MKINTKLNVGFIIACFLPLIAATCYSIYYYNGKLQYEVQERINSDLKAAELIYQAEMNRLKNLAIYHASIPSLKFLLNSVFTMRYNFDSQLEKQLKKFVYDNDLTSAAVLTLRFERFPRDAKLYEVHALRALNEDVSTGIERTEQGKLTLVASAPVYNKDGDIVGATVLTRRFLEAGILDEIRRQTGANAYFAVIDPESSELERDPVKPFYKAPKSLAKTLEIKNAQGVPVGSLVVWRSTEAYDKTRYTAMLVFLLIGLGGVGLAALLRYLITRMIVRPVYTLRKATDSVEAGDFDTRVNLSGYDEIGVLGRHFNSMAEKIEKSFVSQVEELRQKDTEIALRTRELTLALDQLEAIQEILENRVATPENATHGHQQGALPEEALAITVDSASEFQNALSFICSFTQILIDFIDDLKTELTQTHPRQEVLEQIFQELPQLARTIYHQGCHAETLLRRLLKVDGDGDRDGSYPELAFTVTLPDVRLVDTSFSEVMQRETLLPVSREEQRKAEEHPGA